MNKTIRLTCPTCGTPLRLEAFTFVDKVTGEVVTLEDSFLHCLSCDLNIPVIEATPFPQ